MCRRRTEIQSSTGTCVDSMVRIRDSGQVFGSRVETKVEAWSGAKTRILVWVRGRQVYTVGSRTGTGVDGLVRIRDKDR